MDRIAIIRFVALMAITGCAFKTPEDIPTTSSLGAPKETKPFSSPNPALEPMVHGIWQGQLPCADCEGIAYTLILQKDKTFEESSEYKGKNVKPFTEKGTWLINSDSIVQLTRASGTVQFHLSKNSLVMLDPKGQPVTSASANKYNLHRSSEGGSGSTALDSKRREGIDFVATGNKPSWNLDIDTEKMMRFQNGNLKLSSPVPTEQKLPEGKGVVYRAITEAGTLTVRILNQPCTDATSGQALPYKVEVTANSEDFVGCGQYLEDYRLNDIWALQQMNGKPIVASDFPKGQPTLELQLKPKKVSGYSGCNQMNGNLEVKGDKLTFGTLAGTRMACPDPAMAMEGEYLKLLSGHTYNYVLEPGLLTLRDKDKAVMVYKKVD